MFGLDDNTTARADKFLSTFWKILKSSLNYKGEEILIVSDYGYQENILASMLAYGYYSAAFKKGMRVNILFQEVKKGFMRADEHVIKAIEKLKKGSIIVLCLSNKLGRFSERNSFRTFCRERNHRFLSATGLGNVAHTHFELFMEAMGINYSRLKKKGLAIKKKWDKAKIIRVKTDLGTDVTFDVTDMQAVANVGEYHKSGQGGNMPAGEVYIPPKGMDGVNGKVMIDGSMKTQSGAVLLSEPLTLFIEKGRIVKIEGAQAALLEETFRKFENRAKYPHRIRHIAELGVGINPSALLIGSMIMDEKVMGTGHIAIGSNHWFGGEIKTIYHGDQVFKSPTFYVDGEKMDI